LPISPQTPDNIKLEVNNIPLDNQVTKLQQSRDAELQQAQQSQQSQQQQSQMSQQNINQFVSGIQQASASGLTSLPSRDIPQSQSHLTQDQQMRPNYIPQETQNMDYITEHQTNEDIIRKHAQSKRTTCAKSLLLVGRFF